MTLFILTFFSIYGAIHVYAFIKAQYALKFGWQTGTELAFFMLVMVLAPFLIRMLERAGYDLSPRVLSYVGYIWLAVLFLFFCASVGFDLYHLLVRVAVRITPSAASFWISSRSAFFLSLGLSLAVCIYGYFAALDIKTERLMIETDKLPAGTDRLIIAQISDVHLGLIVRCDRLDRILRVVKAANPDILVSTGDLVDGQIDRLPGLADRLRMIQPRYGKYAITGNHEYYAGIEAALSFTRDAGFSLLLNEARDIGPIVIAGVNDRTGAQMKKNGPKSDREVLAKFDTKKFILFLKHQPHPDSDAIGMFDLQLSGHTHNGQIWPFTYVSTKAHPLQAGRYDVGKGSIVYTSRGSGTWGPPIRFLAPPEVTIIELVRKAL